ncbi:MAG: hypothetical protein Q7R79_02810 [bacterium]|nr:hypothetical protein [bacterium]
MATKTTEKEYKEMIVEITTDLNVLAFWLDGSHGKGAETKHSDYDGTMIVKDAVLNQYKKKYGSKRNPEIELKVLTLSQLKKYAEYGSGMEWDRYNFAHLTTEFDRTKKIQAIIDGKSTVPKNIRKKIISPALGAFINLAYRAEKNIRDGDSTAAQLDTIEAIPFFLDAIFTLEGRVRPYNKYLTWGLEKYPLTLFPWKKGQLIKKITSAIAGDGKSHALLDLLLAIRPIFKKAGYTVEFDEWKGYYKIGE